MAEYYTKAESDAKYAATSHTHALEEMGGELIADQVVVTESTSELLGNAYTVDEALAEAANQLSGKAPTNHTHTGYATAGHEHSGYAPVSHEHTGYAEDTHTHTPDAIGAAPATHTHSYNDLTDKPETVAAYTHPETHPASMITGLADVATTGSYNDLDDKPTIPTIPSSLPANGGNADTVDGKHASDFATASHSHSGYASSNHTHTASDVGAAASNHTHTPSSIGAAAASHTHSGYASSSHTHTAANVGALPASGGTISGALTVTGAGTIKGKTYTQQILPFDGGSYSIGASDNRYYSTYLRVNPNVSSDRRCKRDIAPMDINALATFVNKLSVVNYNYNDDVADEAKRIGLIAQDVVAADPTIAQGCIEQDEKGFYSLRAADLVFPLIAAVQALTKRVEELEGK